MKTFKEFIVEAAKQPWKKDDLVDFLEDEVYQSGSSYGGGYGYGGGGEDGDDHIVYKNNGRHIEIFGIPDRKALAHATKTFQNVGYRVSKHPKDSMGLILKM